MGKIVTPTYFVDIYNLNDIVIYGSIVTNILQQWELALSVDELVYENRLRIFYSNIDITGTRFSRVVAEVAVVRIVFYDTDLSKMLGIFTDGLDLYNTRNELEF